ncbi:DMT family transporter [Sporomusa termitida]|uniref:2A78: carboxylate/amino acid/amine transporter n=1 Tax=Sporomusa termitida TaxID=2377 RepID=A0A517DPV0_9FIRM|nr:DMT family transporter [Sporomusa termitida]QDR79395.1 2A78: carboxylate/amino acid/amine transporter [Sporomusa termitida]
MQSVAGALFLAAAFSLAGTSIIAGRLVCEVLEPFTITAVSLFFALLGLVPFYGPEILSSLGRLTGNDWRRLLLQALLGIFLFRLFLLLGLRHTSAGEAGLLTGATPAFTALLGWIFLQEPLSPARCLGIGCTVAGILTIQGLWSAGIVWADNHLPGNLLVLCAALSESLFNLLSRRSSITTAAGQALIVQPAVWASLVAGTALVICLGPAIAENQAEALLSLPVSGWLALAWYGFFVTALAFICWYQGIKRCDVAVAAAFSGLMPLTALILSVLLLDEQINWSHWLGGLLIVLGMWLLTVTKPFVQGPEAPASSARDPG